MPRVVSLDNFQQFAAINLTADPGYDRNNRVIPNCAEIDLVWILEGGALAHNVLHGSYSGSYQGSQAQADTILTQLHTHANWTPLAGFLATATQLATVQLRDLGRPHAPIISALAPGAGGSSPSSALPNEVATVVTLRTSDVGPQNRGRMYLTGFATNALGAGNVIAASAVTAINNWASIIAGVLQSQGYIFGIGHFHRLAYNSPANGSPHDERPAGVVPITNVTVRDNHWDTQRRRGLK